ncbi:hypothetical protein FB567DRAFT_590902 [Paraphoma chrysanthemicola]|uniref:Uncharacterized protein n=1 Tax=Paraphoma chrysanthemicola TaxID=798071 RepID=A0A8K0RAU5_9PLEO|nr:hypothetical protein FB567DRAFT_590902 [Paraphoma chrysanthemicola]
MSALTMPATRTSPLERRYDVASFYRVAQRDIGDNFAKVPDCSVVSWIDVREEVDQAEFHPWALPLGLMRKTGSNDYKVLVAYMKCSSEIIVCIRGPHPRETSRSELQSAMLNAPFIFTSDTGDRSRNLKLKALCRYYFLDAGHCSEIVDKDGTMMTSFKHVCSMIARAICGIDDAHQAKRRVAKALKKNRMETEAQQTEEYRMTGEIQTGAADGDAISAEALLDKFLANEDDDDGAVSIPLPSGRKWSGDDHPADRKDKRLEIEHEAWHYLTLNIMEELTDL